MLQNFMENIDISLTDLRIFCREGRLRTFWHSFRKKTQHNYQNEGVWLNGQIILIKKTRLFSPGKRPLNFLDSFKINTMLQTQKQAQLTFYWSSMMEKAFICFVSHAVLVHFQGNCPNGQANYYLPTNQFKCEDSSRLHCSCGVDATVASRSRLYWLQK